jgi:acyl-coenzyme A synthetase/AMP-(fatty) acid ligase
VFVDDIPHTATGKIQKTELRNLFAGYEFSTDPAKPR